MAWMQQLRAVDWGHASVCVLMAYSLGCLTTGYYLVRTMAGLDIRTVETGSVGARNVGRVLGKTGFFITVLGDFGKGALAVWIARRFTSDNFIAALAMIAVIAGHIWPAQLKFHGGKGVSTSLGALLVWNYQVALAFIPFFLAAFVMTRRMTMPGLFAFACLPFATLWLMPGGPAFTIVLALVTIVLFAHRKNISQEFHAFASRRVVESQSRHTKL